MLNALSLEKGETGAVFSLTLLCCQAESEILAMDLVYSLSPKCDLLQPSASAATCLCGPPLWAVLLAFSGKTGHVTSEHELQKKRGWKGVRRESEAPP